MRSYKRSPRETHKWCYFLSQAFNVSSVNGVQVTMHGLGRPMNWVVKKILRSLLRRHLSTILEKAGKEVIQQELNNASAAIANGDESMLSLIPSLFPWNIYTFRRDPITAQRFSSIEIVAHKKYFCHLPRETQDPRLEKFNVVGKELIFYCYSISPEKQASLRKFWGFMLASKFVSDIL